MFQTQFIRVFLFCCVVCGLSVKDSSQKRSYVCYEPENGVQGPVLTIIGTNGGNIDQKVLSFIQNNRVSYAIANGHRYCELTYLADPVRQWSWQRFPLTLAVLPCSDYVVFIDGDAVIVNNEFSFQPWIQQMDSMDLNVLLAKDYIKESPVQFGVYMVRNSPDIYKYLEELYNICVCDWSRMNDWPREQGLIYDYLELQKRSVAPNSFKSKIISFEGWNDQANQINPKMTKDHFILHYAGCCYNKEQSKWDFQSRWMRMIDNYVEYFGNATGAISQQQVHRKVDSCLPIRSKQMITSYNYFKEKTSYQLSDQSVMNLVTTPAGHLSGIHIYSIQCPHAPHMTCRIPQFWHTNEGRQKTEEELSSQYGDVSKILQPANA